MIWGGSVRGGGAWRPRLWALPLHSVTGHCTGVDPPPAVERCALIASSLSASASLRRRNWNKPGAIGSFIPPPLLVPAQHQAEAANVCSPQRRRRRVSQAGRAATPTACEVGQRGSRKLSNGALVVRRAAAAPSVPGCALILLYTCLCSFGDCDLPTPVKPEARSRPTLRTPPFAQAVSPCTSGSRVTRHIWRCQCFAGGRDIS